MTTQAKQGIGRREFLVLTSSTAIAAMAFGQDLVPSFGKSAASARGFSIGFAEPDAIEHTTDRFVSNVLPAERVTSADGAFVRNGARFFIRACNVASTGGTESVELLALYSVRTGAMVEKVPYGVFSYSKSKGRGSASNAVKFTIPLDDDYRVRLLLNVTPADAAAAAATPAATSAAVSRRGIFTTAQGAALESGSEPQVIDLTLKSGNEGTKLRRGFYMIAPLAAGQSAPQWDRLQLRNDKGLALFDGSGLDVKRADFDYVILSVDYAGDVPRPDRQPAIRD